MAKYKATVGLQNKSGDRFEIGDTVTDKDFPKKIIAGWVKKGNLVPLEKPVPEVKKED